MADERYRSIKISYIPSAEQDVFEMMKNDIWSFMLQIKQVCNEKKLDPYNFNHFLIAIELLKMKVSYN